VVNQCNEISELMRENSLL